MTAPRQVTLARLAELGIVPDTRLGQHFLLDDNLVRVALRLAAVTADDVVLEIGPGLGVLTVALAGAARHVHAIELDARLVPALEATLQGRTNVTLALGDALRFDFATLDPPPTALVANLPYNIAASLLVESLDALPTVERWSAMLQREVCDRLLAGAGTPAYGGISVLVALACERTGMHPVSRRVFVPQPRVDSALVGLRRRDDWPALAPRYAGVKRLVQAAFAYRRKRLANSVAQAGLASREAVTDALATLGLEPGVRAEQLPPATFVALAQALAI